MGTKLFIPWLLVKRIFRETKALNHMVLDGHCDQSTTILAIVACNFSYHCVFLFLKLRLDMSWF